MSFFGSTKTYVSSVCYNLGGDIAKRPNFLKTTVVGATIGKQTRSISNAITDGYLHGPGIKLRRFYDWAEDNYDKVGMPYGTVYGAGAYSVPTLEEQITAALALAPTTSLWVTNSSFGAADYGFWADQWMLANHPDLIDTAWVSEFDEDAGNIVIIFEDLTTATFTPTGFDREGVYLYASYGVIDAPEPGEVDFGSGYTFVASAGEYPSTAGYTYIGMADDTIDGVSYFITLYRKLTAGGVDGTGSYREEHTLYLRERDEVASPDPTKYSWQEGVRRVYDGGYDYTGIYIYKLGSGNTLLDAFILNPDITHQGFYPYIPLRIDNQFLSSTYLSTVYDQTKKAYKKLTNTKIEDMIEKIEENESLDDIDFAYVLPAVPLNTQSNTGKRYLFDFFELMLGSSLTTDAEYATWAANAPAYSASMEAWVTWRIAQFNPSDPLYGTDEPIVLDPPREPKTAITFKSVGTVSIPNSLTMNITWQKIEKTTGSGLLKPDAKKGDYWVQLEADPPHKISYTYTGGTNVEIEEALENSCFSVNHQIDEDSWETLTVTGAVHRNLIYNGKAVEISAKEAINDDEESGFLIPLHYPTVAAMGIVDYTQLSVSSLYLVLNCYKVVKTKWYQTGFFKLVVFIVILAITIAFPPAGGVGAGLLGSAAAVGLAIGLTGTLAIIAGAIINYLVSMIVMKLIMMASVEIFGEKFGALIGAIVSFVGMTVGVGLANGANMSSIWGSMMSAPGLISLTSAVGNGISGYVNASAMAFAEKTEQLVTEYDKQMSDLNQKFAQEFGSDKAWLDPLGLTGITLGNPLESSASFLARTLLTGSDIAEMSMDMLTNFAEYTLTTDLP